MATLEKYMTPNTDYYVGAVVQSEGKFIFGAQVNGWQKDEKGTYLVPFDVVCFKAKRDETIPQTLARIYEEELGDPSIETTNLRDGQAAIMTDMTFLFEPIEGKAAPAYISIHKKATSSKINAEAYVNTFVYSGKSANAKFKSLNMQALFKTPPALLRKVITGKYTLGAALNEGMEIMDPKIQIPEDSIFVPQNNLIEFMRFLKEAMK